MADGYGFSLFPRATQSQSELLTNRAHFLDVIEKRNIAKRRRHPRTLRRFVSDGGRCRATVNVKEMIVAEHRHQLAHQVGIGSGFRALMVVDADGPGNILQKLVEELGP